MSTHEHRFRLPAELERYLAALSKLYAHEGKKLPQAIIVNGRTRVHEGWSQDNWNGGRYGHALYLTVPEALYLVSARERGVLQEQIKTDLNKLHNIQNEFIEEVFIDMDALQNKDWRRDSGLLQSRQTAPPAKAAKRIWGGDGYRVFLSHKHRVKKEAARLKASLQQFGVSSFVAHEDIRPTKEWQREIENALNSMDAFVALLTPEFHDSLWTDQEVGFALGRDVPIVALKLGTDPYGFIGKFQALKCEWADAPIELVNLFIKEPRMIDAFIGAAKACKNFDDGNTLAKVLPHIDAMTEQQVEQLVAAFNDNGELKGSFGFNGNRPLHYGDGLAAHLERTTGRKYRVAQSGEIRVAR